MLDDNPGQLSYFDFHGGVRIATYLTLPPQAADAPKALVLLCHGFSGARYPGLIEQLAGAGFAVLAIDFPGYGRSGGDPSRILPLEQADVVLGAADWVDRDLDPELAALPKVLVGSSLGGSVALIATAKDDRFVGCVAGCPLAVGRNTLRANYPTEAEWQEFRARIDRALESRETFHRFEIVYIPEAIRDNLPAGTPMEFTAQTAKAFAELSVVASMRRITDTPVLIVHSTDDEVVPVEEARMLADAAAGPCDLVILDKGNHFIFKDEHCNSIVVDWIERLGLGAMT